MNEQLQQQVPAVVPGDGRRFVIARGFLDNPQIDFQIADVIAWASNGSDMTPMVFDNELGQAVTLGEYADTFGGSISTYRLLPAEATGLSEEEVQVIEAHICAKRSALLKYQASPEAAAYRERVKRQYEALVARQQKRTR